MSAPLKKRQRKLEYDFRMFGYMLDNDFQPRFDSLIQALSDFEKLGDSAPTVPSKLFMHIVKRLQKRNGRPMFQFSVTEYEAVLEDYNDFQARQTELKQARSNSGSKVRGERTPYQIALAEFAKKRKISAGTAERLLAKLKRSPNDNW